MHSIKGIEDSEGGHRDIRWIITANAATSTATTPAPEIEKSTSNVDEPRKSNEKINTPTTFSNKKCF